MSHIVTNYTGKPTNVFQQPQLTECAPLCRILEIKQSLCSQLLQRSPERPGTSGAGIKQYGQYQKTQSNVQINSVQLVVNAELMECKKNTLLGHLFTSDSVEGYWLMLLLPKGGQVYPSTHLSSTCRAWRSDETSQYRVITAARKNAGGQAHV